MAEIVAAYHAAKNAFSKDSVATYSLFDADEVQSVIARIDEAFQTLSNLEKRAEYDKLLLLQSRGEIQNPMSELERMRNAEQVTRKDTVEEVRSMGTPAAPFPNYDFSGINGAMLKDIREKRGLSAADVCRITKIPSRFLAAMETDRFDQFPARVYVQGFIKNLVALYKIPGPQVLKSYLEYLDKSGVAKT